MPDESFVNAPRDTLRRGDTAEQLIETQDIGSGRLRN